MKKLYKAKNPYWVVFAVDSDEYDITVEASNALGCYMEDSCVEIKEIKSRDDVPEEDGWEGDNEPYGHGEGLTIDEILEESLLCQEYMGIAETINNKLTKLGWENDDDFVADLTDILRKIELSKD